MTVSHSLPNAEDLFPAGSELSLRLSDGRASSVHIIKSFTPFTKAQVFLVQSEEGDNLPSKLILKVYDPRFLNDRFPPVPSVLPHPWTLDAESLAAQYRTQVALGERADDFHEDLLYDETEADPWLWEEHFYRQLIECFRSEVDAYSRLKTLQGHTIPKFYTSGKLVPTPHVSRAIEPPVVLIEYIPGVSLYDVKPGAIPGSICARLIKDVDSFVDHGVFHGDLNPGNVLFTPAEAPKRAVIIDFGVAGVRTSSETDEQWAEAAGFYYDGLALRRTLMQKGVTVEV